MKFSLVIPVAPNRRAEILRSIERLDYPKIDYEVIVVRGRNPSENRNKGAEMAKGDIIAFLDDDAILPKDYLIKAESFFNEYSEIDIVGGPQLTPHDDGYFAKISGSALASKFGAWDKSSRYQRNNLNLNAHENDITSANLICRKKITSFLKFHTKIFPGEDPKFIIDAKNNGYKVAYSPTIVVYHRRRHNPKELVIQIFSYGKVRTKIDSFINTLKNPILFIPSFFSVYIILLLLLPVYYNLLNSIFVSEIIFPVLFSPLILYLILAISFAVYEGLKNKSLGIIILLPFVFLTIHLSYGFGFIYGYLRILRRNICHN